MNANNAPLSYGVRQAIRDSPKTTYQIGTQSKVSPQNLYRFLDDDHPRSLSQKSLDSLGLFLGLKLTYRGSPPLSGHGRDYRIVFDDSKRVVAIDKLIRGTGDVPLSTQLGSAVRLHKKGLEEIAGTIGISLTQLYRFLDRSRGLSQAKLDSLCCLLGLVVEGPTVFIPPRRAGAMLTTERRIYIPKPTPEGANLSDAEGRQAPKASPPSLFVPPEDESYGDD